MVTQIFLHKCTTYSDLPSYISTRVSTSLPRACSCWKGGGSSCKRCWNPTIVPCDLSIIYQVFMNEKFHGFQDIIRKAPPKVLFLVARPLRPTPYPLELSGHILFKQIFSSFFDLSSVQLEDRREVRISRTSSRALGICKQVISRLIPLLNLIS